MDVLDGQQRLVAIRDFVDSKFPIDGTIAPQDEAISALGGLTYRQLNPPDRRIFDQYTLRCFRITDYLPDEPSELFYRLNQTSILTAGEQRNAFYGPAREQLKRLVDIFERSGNDRSTIGFSNTRLAYDDIIARLLFFIEEQSFAIKGTESSISQRFRAREEFSTHVVDLALESIERFSAAREELGAGKFNKASTLSWLLFYCRSNGSKGQIAHMRRFKFSESDEHEYTPYPPRAKEAKDLFDDRASLRVTDVSSVVYRDFCLWYTFSLFGGESLHVQPPACVPHRILSDIVHRLDLDYSRLESVLSEHLNIAQWSALP